MSLTPYYKQVTGCRQKRVWYRLCSQLACFLPFVREAKLHRYRIFT